MLNTRSIATLYVSQKHGQDSYMGICPEITNDGTGPLKSVQAALAKIADMRADDIMHPISIVITDKVYSVTEPIIVDNSIGSVTIRGLDSTIISGGFNVTGFKQDTLNGKDCFSAEIDALKDGLWFTDFYVDGMRAETTKLPREGFFYPERVENEGDAYDSESKWFIAKPEDLEYFKKLHNVEDCLITYCHFWVDEHSPIEKIDFETGRVDMLYRSRYSLGGSNQNTKMKYQLENVAEGFEQPNDWYLDRTTAKLYYIPRNATQTPENIDAYLPLCEKLFIIQGTKDNKVSDIAFQNLTFAYTKGDYNSRIKSNSLEKIADDEVGYACDEQAMCSAYGAIEFYHAHACSIERCRFTCLGLHAITINAGCDKCRVYANRFLHLGGGAIKMCGGAYGCEKSDETHSNLISQNEITHIGERYYASTGIMIMHGYGNTVSHNEIGYTYYTGISCGWVWGYGDNITRENFIEKNHVHHIGQGRLSDMGAIYLLGKQPGTIVRGNIVHDVAGYKYGGTGIYTDEGSSYILIENNIVYNIHTSAYNHHFGKMNTVRNNIFAKAGKMVQITRQEEHTSLILEKNIFVSTTGNVAYGFGTSTAPGERVDVSGGSYNLHFDTSKTPCLFIHKEKSYDLETAQKTFGVEHGSVYADPLFADFENNDYILTENSPAYMLGFKPIEISDVGITIKL